MWILIPVGLIFGWAFYEASRGKDVFFFGGDPDDINPEDYDFGKYD